MIDFPRVLLGHGTENDFVVLPDPDGAVWPESRLDAALVQRLKAAIRSALTPRHVPDEIFQVAAIPRTLSGKKMELPVRKLMLGTPPDQVFKRDAMANAGAVDWFIDFARRRAAADAAAGP